MPNVHELIRDHVTLSIRCLDRLNLHAYMPKLQTSGGPLLLPARSLGVPDSVAGVVHAHPRSVDRGHQDVRGAAGRAADHVRAGPTERRRGRRASRASADGRRGGRDRRNAREDAGVQGHVEFKSSHVKQYFKEQRALRTETTINNPNDFYVNKAVPNLSHLRDLGNQVNRKLLEVERVSHQCVLTQDALDRLQQPTVERAQRVSALRFGDPRLMVLFQAITGFAHLPRGFRNRDLRAPVATLLGRPYSAAQMTYDLRRLWLKGVIHRIPTTHRYTATSYGLKVAFFCAKLYLRILRPEWTALLPLDDQLSHPLRTALDALDVQIREIHEEAALAA
jgi:hypothetical protein